MWSEGPVRRRKRREINIFTVSALDLFASAMGVFLLIAIVSLPYYLKSDRSLVEELAEARKKIEKLEKENAELIEQQISTLLGLSTSARSFVLVVDMSGSMKEYSSIVSETVEKIIENLSDGYSLQIIGYHLKDRILHWQKPYKLVPMNPKSRKEGIEFMHSLIEKFDGATPTRLALTEALKYDAEAIILLTDGAPSFNAPLDIVKDITAMNGGKKEIYTIAIGDYRAKPILVEFLEALSRRNGGGFIGISNY